MNQKNLIITALVLTLTLAVSGMASAYGGGKGPRGGNGQGFGQMFDQLTPEKQAAVKAIFAKHHDKMVTISNDLWAKNTELDALVASGSATKKDIQSLVGDIADLRADMQETRDALHAEIEAETGLQLFGGGFGDCPGRGNGGGYGHGMGRGMGGGMGGGGYGDCPRAQY